MNKHFHNIDQKQEVLQKITEITPQFFGQAGSVSLKKFDNVI